MSLNSSFIKVVFIVFGLSMSVLRQSPLRNQDIVTMVRQGLSETIVIAKIQSTESDFDVSTDAIKILSDSGVSDAIVVEMIKVHSANRIEEAKRNEIIERIPEKGTLNDIVGLRRVYLVTFDAKSREYLEKAIKKSKLLELVSKIEESDFVMKYETWSVLERVAGQTTQNRVGDTTINNSSATPLYRNFGKLKVAMPSPETGRVREVYEVEKSEYYVWQKNPAKTTIKQFLEDFEAIIKSSKNQL